VPPPRITVVTICRNAADSIERTLRSVAAQDYPALEYVVVDGASTDGTLAILERYRGRIDRLASEPDRGIAHAFNKGIALGTGEWFLMLNAGDALIAPDALRRLVGRSDGGARILTARSRCGTRSHPRYRIRDGLSLILRSHLSHQATLVQRAVYAEYGGYDESFRIRMDTDFFLRVLQKEKLAYLDDWLVEFLPGGVSGREFWLNWREARRAVIKNRCGPLSRLEFEALFSLAACERLLRPGPT